MFEYAAELKHLKTYEKLRVILSKMPVLLIFHDENVYAIADKCPHMGASLQKGTIKDHAVTCKAHKAVIDFVTGEILEKAHIAFLKMPTKKAKIFPVRVEDEKVYVDVTPS